MKFAISGSSGFVGRNLTQWLQDQGHDWFALERGQTSTEMIQLFKAHKPDVVIHLAALFIAEHRSEQIDDLIDGNFRFAHHILEAMARTDCKKIVLVGSHWQHFEQSAYRATNLYAALKSCTESLADYYQDAFAVQYRSVKFTDTYGRGDTRGKLLSLLMKSLVHDQSFELSPGNQIINLVHITDVISGLMAVVNTFTDSKNANGKYILASDEECSLKDLVARLEKLSGQKLQVKFGAKPYRFREVMTPQKLDAKIPQWSCQISLDQGLKELIDEARK